jgi:hypothetical protein
MPGYHWNTTALLRNVRRAAFALRFLFFFGIRSGLHLRPTAPFSPGDPPEVGIPCVAHQSALRSSVRNAIGMTSGSSTPRAAMPRTMFSAAIISRRRMLPFGKDPATSVAWR